MSGVTISRSGGVAVIGLCAPRRNALSMAVLRDLRSAAATLAASDETRVVIVQGSGTVFCSGADINELAGMTHEFARGEFQPLLESTMAAVEEMPQPVIAAINGHAMGGGLELALACDIRVCSLRARLALPEIFLGLIPGAGGTQRLTRVAGQGLALDVILTGREMNAHDARMSGVVSAVFDDVGTAARSLAETLATHPRLALQAAKRAIRAAGAPGGFEVERDAFVGLFGSPDHEAGTRHFLSKAPGRPVFSD